MCVGSRRDGCKREMLIQFFFNGIMSSRRRHKDIQLLQVKGNQIERVHGIRSTIFNHFSAHFRKIQIVRPSAENLRFRQLSVLQAGTLIRPFYGRRGKTSNMGL